MFSYICDVCTCTHTYGDMTAREAQKARYDIALKVKSSYARTTPGTCDPWSEEAQISSASASATSVDGAAQWGR